MNQQSNIDNIRQGFRSHSSHWGAFRAEWDGSQLRIVPHEGDPDPSDLLKNFPDALRHKSRVARPAIRRGWLEKSGPASRRAGDDFVEVPWDEALDLVADKLRSVTEARGPQSVFGGSYGWASAGRFHHAQSQLHRFLNMSLGGYVRSVNNYSAGAALVLLPHILGPYDAVTKRNVTWEQVQSHTDIVLAFGGLPVKNTAVASGGTSSHMERPSMTTAQANGTRFVLVSPMRDDMVSELDADWFPVRPASDVALMLAIAHVLVSDGLHDRAYLDRFTSGYDQFEVYLLGQTDGTPKTPEWAASLTGIDAARIRELAHSLASKRVLIVTAQSLQRARFGEQPIWMAATLAAMLGQIGLPGGGFNYALGSLAHYGRRQVAVPLPTLGQGANAVDAFIPVSRIADMLLHPGETYDYNGQRLTYPEVDLLYWVGGNPFHHHQDLNRLKRGFDRVDTIVVQESFWTPMARHADVVLPATMTLERNDVACSRSDPSLIAMQQVAPAFAEARDDYTIFSQLSARLGAQDRFTEGRSAEEWLRHLYEPTREALAGLGCAAPCFEEFWNEGALTLPQHPDDGGMLRAFQEDPEANPLPTATGKIVLHSDVIGGFGYADCPAHPTWLPPEDAPREEGEFHLVANQPARRLHSQLDFGSHSTGGKTKGRETVRVNPADADALGVRAGDIVRLWNRRGACLAGVAITEEVRPGVLNLPTGAWYDPEDPLADAPLCVHGNPNVLTLDVGTSRLAQGCSGQLTTVRIARIDAPVPPVRAYDPPFPTAAQDKQSDIS